MTDTPDLMSIGEFSSRSRLSVRMLRHYGEHGILVPADVDAASGYRRFGIGVQLSSLLFAQDYWIDDPWSYRLPDPYGPYRWVRYYNDALLVDVETGEVVDAIHDLFW